MKIFCPQCGWDVPVDEDHCCTLCGATAFGCCSGYKIGCDCGDHDFHIGDAEAQDRYLAEHGEVKP
jgi:hypothetical protein